MQIIHADSLLNKKEDIIENLCGQQKARRTERIVCLGDYAKCPQCHQMGRVVWVSQDGKLAGIQCPGRHSQMTRGESRFGSTARPQTRPEKNMVFLMETEMIRAIASAQR